MFGFQVLIIPSQLRSLASTRRRRSKYAKTSNLQSLKFILQCPSAPLDPSKLDIAGAHDAVAPVKDIFRPFPEEFAMQGLGFTAGYFPEKWFGNENVEPETHYLEAESMRSQHRPERVQWLGVQLAELAPEWIGYSNEDGCTFSLGEKAKEYLDDTEGESGSGSGSEYGDEIDSDRGSKARSESGTLTMEVDDRPVSQEAEM
jgi:hypothetical protein